MFLALKFRVDRHSFLLLLTFKLVKFTTHAVPSVCTFNSYSKFY